MVSSVSSGGYQAYSYQQAVNPQVETRAGENRIQQRPSPVGDSNRGDQRDASSRDEKTEARSTTTSSRSESPARGRLVDVSA